MILRLAGKFFRYTQTYGLKAALKTAFYYGALLLDRTSNRYLGTSKSSLLKINKVEGTKALQVTVVIHVDAQTEALNLQALLAGVCGQKYQPMQICVEGAISDVCASVIKTFESQKKFLNQFEPGDLTWICEMGCIPKEDFLTELVDKMADESVMWAFCKTDGDSTFTQTKSCLLSRKQFLNMLAASPFPDYFYGSSVFRGSPPNIKATHLGSFFNQRTLGGAIYLESKILNKTDILKTTEKEVVADSSELSKPHIAMCATGFISGGGETFPIRLANFLKRAGYPVTFLNFDLYPRNEGIRGMLDANVPVVNLQSVRHLKSIVEAHGFDIIHSHNATIDIIISEAKLDRTKHFVTLHGMYESKGQEHLARHIPMLFKSVNQWIYTTDKNLSAFKTIEGFSQAQFTKIGNGIELKSHPIVDPATFGMSVDSFIVCLASRAIREKGWAEAIEIVIEVRRQTQKDVRLVLLGDGPLFEHFKGHAPSFVQCVGFQDNVAGFFAMSHVFLFPTTFQGESFPLVILDALSVGTPVIASDIGEIRKMLTNDGGEVSGDIFNLDSDWGVPISKVVEILSKYVNDRDYLQRKSKVSAERVKQFDMTSVVQQYCRVYDRTIV